MFRDVAMHDAAALMRQYDEHKESLACEVGTVKPSQATRSWIWLCRNAFHGGEDGLWTWGRYCSTVDVATSMPRFRRSPTRRGEPQGGFDCHISWLSWRASYPMVGRPGLPL
jgi:hypothetical protein